MKQKHLIKWDRRSLSNIDLLDEKTKIGLLAVDFARKLTLTTNK